MTNLEAATVPVVISPSESMLELFLRTGRWPKRLPLMPMLSDRYEPPEEREADYGLAAPLLRR
ncbi:MAG: hypothetical protein V1797_21205 [Pseudomonadota bacterium]